MECVTPFLLAFFLGLIPAAMARSKGRSFGLWWLFGFALFIVALPASFMISHSKICPHCRKGVDPQATICPFCQSQILVTPKGCCSNCGESLPVIEGLGTSSHCRKCGYNN